MKNIKFYKAEGTVYIRVSDVETLLKIGKKEYIDEISGLVHTACEKGTMDVRSGRKTIKRTNKVLDEFIGPIIKWINENVRESIELIEKEIKAKK